MISAGSGDEFPTLPDGSRVPFRRSHVLPLEGGDFAHFMGQEGAGGGGHRADSSINGATRFPQVVWTIDDLQAVQDLVVARVRLGAAKYGRYWGRELVEYEGRSMIVNLVLESDGTPTAMYPISGEGVTKLVDGVARTLPLDLRDLIGWDT